MERFRNILFASSGGKQDLAALERVNHLAMANRARVTFVRVIEELPWVSCFLPNSRLTEFQEASLAQAEAELENLAKRLDPELKVKTRVLKGKPFIELIRTATADSHDILIKSTTPTSKERGLESTDLHLLRKCPVPLWIVKPNQRKPFGKILVAVDPDPSVPERFDLHRDLLKLGISLAEREAGKVEVVHVWTLEGEATLQGPRFRMSPEEIAALAARMKQTRQSWLDDLLKPYADRNLKTTLVKGKAGPTLVEVIEKKRPDIVVMGTVARTGLPGFFIGNTAEFVLSQINCSILTIKPCGFKTPVV